MGKGAQGENGETRCVKMLSVACSTHTVLWLLTLAGWLCGQLEVSFSLVHTGHEETMGRIQKDSGIRRVALGLNLEVREGVDGGD